MFCFQRFFVQAVASHNVGDVGYSTRSMCVVLDAIVSDLENEHVPTVSFF